MDVSAVVVIFSILTAALLLVLGFVLGQRWRAEKTSATSAAWQLLADHATEVVWTTDLEGRLTFVSPSVSRLRGFSVDEVMAQSPGEAVCPGSLATARSSRDSWPSPVEFELLRKDGTSVWTETTGQVLLEAGQAVGWVGVTRDISARRVLETQLSEVLPTDGLTGAMSRGRFFERAEEETRRAYRHKTPLALVVLDLDHFQRLNETQGLAAGDEALVTLTLVCRRNIREIDLLARLGGDEFGLMMPETAFPHALVVVDRIRKDLESLVSFTISVGVADWAGEGDQLKAWIERGTQALSQAKDEGRNRVVGRPASPTPVPPVLIPWQSEWESGNRPVDEEHRQLLAQANELITMTLSYAPREAILSRLDEILPEVVRHFESEEQILGTLGYPDLAAHRLLHRTIAAEAATLRERFHQGVIEPSELLNFFLGKVLLGHILSADRLFFPYTRSL